MDQKHSSYVGKVYYQKQTSRRIATEGRISREKLSGQYRDSTDAQMSQFFFKKQPKFSVKIVTVLRIKNV